MDKPQRTLNLILLTILSPLLLVTGIVNFFLPDHLYWIDTIWYCNLVHILAGTLGLLVVWKKSPILARRFNLALGMIYLYEVVANFAGLFPARITNWSSVDDMVYLFTGMLLILCGIHGQKKTAIIFTSHTQVS